MSSAYVSSPGVPGIRPRNFNGDGTLSEAGMWSTSSVVTRGSCKYCLINFVYSSSSFCGAAAAVLAAAALLCLLCANMGAATSEIASEKTSVGVPGFVQRDVIRSPFGQESQIVPLFGIPCQLK